MDLTKGQPSKRTLAKQAKGKQRVALNALLGNDKDEYRALADARELPAGRNTVLPLHVLRGAKRDERMGRKGRGCQTVSIILDIGLKPLDACLPGWYARGTRHDAGLNGQKVKPQSFTRRLTRSVTALSASVAAPSLSSPNLSAFVPPS